jgi:hypothetical protein
LDDALRDGGDVTELEAVLRRCLAQLTHGACQEPRRSVA